jgi:hypothetical protein
MSNFSIFTEHNLKKVPLLFHIVQKTKRKKSIFLENFLSPLNLEDLEEHLNLKFWVFLDKV